MQEISAITHAYAPSRMERAAFTVDTAAASPATDNGFLAAIGHGLDVVQADSARASQSLALLATGGDIATHDVVLAMEQARQSLMLATEVRQRLLDAYKEITGMQV